MLKVILDGVELKPCPFCGHYAQYHSHHDVYGDGEKVVECGNPKCVVFPRVTCSRYGEWSKLVTAWNTRAEGKDE